MLPFLPPFPQHFRPFWLLRLLIALVWMRQVPGYLKGRINGLRQFSPSPNSPGNAQEFHLTLGQRCALKQSAVWSDCSPVGRQAAAHSRVIDWINSLIPNRWIEYWCLVSPDHRRKTQSASTAWKLNPLTPLAKQDGPEVGSSAS